MALRGCSFHLSGFCREQMALRRHGSNQQPVTCHVSSGLTPGELQRVVAQLADLQVPGADHLLCHYHTEKEQAIKVIKRQTAEKEKIRHRPAGGGRFVSARVKSCLCLFS